MKTLKTLIKIVKCVGGYELHYRNEEKQTIEIVFVVRPVKRETQYVNR